MSSNFSSPSGGVEAPPVECVPVEASNSSEGLDVEAAGGDTQDIINPQQRELAQLPSLSLIHI